MVKTSGNNSDIKILKEEIKGLRGDIRKLAKVIDKGNFEEKHRYHIATALTFAAMGIGVVFLPADSIKGNSPTIMAFSFFVVACLKYFEALKPSNEPEGFRKVLGITGLIMLAIGLILYSIPAFRNSLVQVYGFLFAVCGLCIIGINTISLKKKAS